MLTELFEYCENCIKKSYSSRVIRLEKQEHLAFMLAKSADQRQDPEIIANKNKVLFT